MATMESDPIRTPDQRLRVFVSSTLGELQPERAAVREAVESLRLAPVMFELGARPHPPRSLYRSYLEQSDIFLGIYWQSYGWVAPDEEISGLEDEYRLSGNLPSLIYIKAPAPDREERLAALLARIRADDRVSYKSFRDAAELRELVVNDLSTLLADRFDAARATAARATGARATGTHPGHAGAASAIPSAYTPIVGRDTERDEIVRMLLTPVIRLVTLVGPGGIGKSRLAIEVATTIAAAGGEVAFALLESLTTAEEVLPAIARAVGVRDTGEQPAEAALLAALEGRDLVLVLDNMEHVLGAADALVRLITALPSLTVLVTSRSPLRLRAEHVYTVAPLAAPGEDASIETIEETASVTLFVQRATAVMPAFHLTAEDAATIAAICRRLDGVPLAIELAAARMRSHTPQEILERLDSALSLLVDGARDLPARQRTIRSTIEWSVRLLDDATRSALGALAVFSGPFTRAAAEATLTGAPGVDAADALDLLVDASLLQQRERRGVRVFTLLSLVHAYADELGRVDAVEERWAEHYRLLAETASHDMTGSSQLAWLHRLDAESENIWAVLRFFIDASRFDEAARMAWSLYLYTWLAGMLGSQQALMSEVLEGSAREGITLSPWTEAVAQYFANAIEFWQHRGRDVLPGLTRSAELFESAGDAGGAALARISLGLALLARKDGPDIPAARDILTRAIDGFASVGNQWGEAMALVTMGRVDLILGETATAMDRFERSLDLASANRERLGIVIAQHHRGWARLAQGDIDGAERDFAAGLKTSLALGHTDGIAYGLEGRAGVAAQRGDIERAGLMIGAASAVRRRMGMIDSGQAALYTPALQALADDDARAVLDAAVARGMGMSPHEVLDAVDS
jgi:predicted ATPase